MSRLQCVVVAIAVAALASPALAQQAPGQPMSFFLTSVGSGNGGDLGGLAGADRHCAMLGAAAGRGDVTWQAYLSTSGPNGVNARDRIGSGPWYNARGRMIAESIDALHSESNRFIGSSGLNKETALDEIGRGVPGGGDTPNRHDILTGSQADGTAFPGTDDTTCQNWTSSDAGSAGVGHHDRRSRTPGELSSWVSAHISQGCSQEALMATGGAGLFYCFATD